ncbi:FAD binding domain-containing protein [Advenella incenata]
MKAIAYTLARAADLNAVITQLQEDELYKVIAGGQSLGAMLNLRLAQLERLVDLDGIDTLRKAEIVEDELLLGAMTTHAEIEDGQVPDVTQGMLAHVARGIAYRAVRNRGTLGGSLCHADPAADWMTAMAAVGAQCETTGPEGTRLIPAAQFMTSAFEPDLRPAEILARIHIPAFHPSARWSYRKHCRKVGEFAMAIVAGVLDPDRGVERLVFGALDGTPHLVERDGLFRELADPRTRAAFLASADLPLPTKSQALHADLLARVLADIGETQ